MLLVDPNFRARLTQGQRPVLYIEITTPFGVRRYSRAEFSLGDTVLEEAARLLDLSGFGRALTPKTGSLLAAYSSKPQENLSVQLADDGWYFNRLLPVEPFLGQRLTAWAGFVDLPQGKHLRIGGGVIDQVTLTRPNGLMVSCRES